MIDAVDAMGLKLDPKNSQRRATLRSLPAQAAVMTKDVADAISGIWHDPCIQKAFNHAAPFSLSKHLPYYIESLRRVTASDYSPSNDDILREYAPTRGINELVCPPRDRGSYDEPPWRMIEIDYKLMKSSKAMRHVFDAHHTDVILFTILLVDYIHHGDDEGEVLDVDDYNNQKSMANRTIESNASCVDILL
jgi:hypothetical protein